MNDNRTHAATGKACPQALEFFAGIGLARLGLEESGFQVEWSNDIDSAKWSRIIKQASVTTE